MGIIFLLLSSLIFYSHSICGIGDWKSYTSKRNVSDITFLQDKLWIATDGGMFTHNLSDSSFQEFSPTEGLKTTDLSSIGIDKDGKIWIGSSSGHILSFQPSMSRWNYYEDIYVLDSPEKSINNLISYGDTLFISSDVGVSVFNIDENRFNDTYIKFGTNPQISGNVKSVLINHDTIWIATDNGIASAWRYTTNLVAPQSWNVFQSANGLPSNNVTSLSVYNNILFASTGNGLAQFNDTNWQTVAGTQSFNIINSISSDSGLYFITTQRLYRLNVDYSIELLNDLSNLTLTSIKFYDGKIFLGTSSKGIIQISNSTLKYILPPGPPTNKLVGLAVESNGDLWAGTGTISTQGFVRYDGKNWGQYNTDNYPQLYNPSYYRVDIGYNNAKWVSGWGQGVAMVSNDNRVLKVYNTTNGLPNTELNPPGPLTFVVVAGVATDRAGNAWINIRTGSGDTLLIVVKPDSSMEYVKSPYHFISTGIAIDNNSTKWLWTGSNGGGLYFYNEIDTVRGMLSGSRWGKVSKTNGLSSDNISVVVVDNEGEIWAGTTDAGINIIYDPSNPLNRIALYYPLKDGNQNINDIMVDPLNQKWIATSKGVYVFSPDGTSILSQYTVLNTNGRLLDDNVLSIAMNRQTGVVYLGTEKGISVLQTTSVTPLNSFGKILISPNPYLIPSNVKAVFDKLVRNTTIKILSIDGKLIKEIVTPGGRVGTWDGTDSDGNYVSSGIYIVAGYSEDGNEVGIGKIAVVRK
jgi:ligand-binding sensor domain-containing protein